MDHPVHPFRFACITLWSLAKVSYPRIWQISNNVPFRGFTFSSLSRERSRRWFRFRGRYDRLFPGALEFISSGWQSQGPIKRYNQFSLFLSQSTVMKMHPYGEWFCKIVGLNALLSVFQSHLSTVVCLCTSFPLCHP